MRLKKKKDNYVSVCSDLEMDMSLLKFFFVKMGNNNQ